MSRHNFSSSQGDLPQSDAGTLASLAFRAAVGGVLMGLANLVPGISGGTMLLAVGIYTVFIGAIADVTRFTFPLRSVIVLVSVVVAAVLGILLLAGPIKNLVIEHRWIMYSLFIGLTLGGVPIVYRMIGGHTPSVWIAAVCGFIGMAVLAWFQQQGAGVAVFPREHWVMLVIAGIAGASAMILPGISGGYLLLILGQYVPILSAVDTLKTGLKGFDTAVISHVFVTVLLPVGIGILVGVIGVSNLLRFLLKRYHRATLGVLLGILLGAVVGLWPFQHAVKPEMGDIIKGETVTTENIHTFEREDYPTDYFTPTFAQVAGSIGLIGAGFLITYYISRFGERGHTQGNHDTA